MGKNMTQMRSDLRLDLTDASTTWSNAELNRCIEKAVADLSRFLPDEKIYEESLQFTVADEPVTFPVAASATAIVSSSIVTTTAGLFAGIAAQPDVPRPLVVKVTDADDSITILSIIVMGAGRDGKSISELFHYGKGFSKTLYGKRYFKGVSSIEIDQIAGNGAGDKLEIGYDIFTKVWIQLGNKPIKKGSVTLDDGGTTTYVEDTDYVMDYTNGRIKALADGDLTAHTEGDACEIGYEKSKISLDLSSLAGFIRIFDVEYPVGQVPQEFQTPDTWDKVITLGGFANESQAEITEDRHISVRYYAEHDAPTEAAPGSYPSFLDWTVELAASAYALFIFAVKYEHQVATDLGSAADALGTTTTDIHTLVDTALGKVTTYVADANDALDLAAEQAVLAAAALVKVATYLEDNSDEDAKGWLTKITTDISELRDAIRAALECSDNYLDRIGAVTGVEATEGDLEAARLVWAEELKHILTESGIPNAEDFLELGDGLINQVNIGSEVPELNRRYAETALNMAEKWAENRRNFLSQAGRRVDAAMGYVANVAQRLSNLRSYIEQSAGWGAIARGFVDEASQSVANTQAYVAVADGKLGICRAFNAEADSRISEIDRHLGQAAAYQASAAAYDGLAVRFREEAIERRNEVWAIWRDPKQYIGQFVTSSPRQTT